MQCYLNIAEKPSVAKTITYILSLQQPSMLQNTSPYNPIYQFPCNIPQQCSHIFTSVTGHLQDLSFKNHFPWTVQKRLFDEQVILEVPEEKIRLKEQLQGLKGKVQGVILWLDCDREGEAIAYEVLRVLGMEQDIARVWRAKFSSLDRTEIINAMSNLQKPDPRLSEAVDTRRELDLRIGAVFTRFQSVLLQESFHFLENNLISYGPCQFPTLSFVVDRFKKIQDFRPEQFWSIQAEIQLENSTSQLTWERGSIFDQKIVAILYENCFQYDIQAKVTSVQQKQKSKYKPYPMNTIEFTKLATQKLRLTSHKAMEIAEKLYNQGIISYPRTETESFNEAMDLKEHVNLFRNNETYGNFVNSLSQGGFQQPRKGKKDDKSHPPIHPVKDVRLDSLSEDERKVYDLITRHFLAVCAQDAKGSETQVLFQIGGEKFRLKGLEIQQRNYLDIYPYDKWGSNLLPALRQGQILQVSKFDLHEGQTTAPNLLTETELISKMDQEQIGTDATIHEHIKTIQDRGYCEKTGNYFRPTQLGLALVMTYNQMEISLAMPSLRRGMESQITMIAEGSLTRETVLQETIGVMKEIYEKLANEKRQFLNIITGFFNNQNNLNNQNNQSDNRSEIKDFVSLCKCKKKIKIHTVKNKEFTTSYLKCSCEAYRLKIPSGTYTPDIICPKCQYQSIRINDHYNICPYCYNFHGDQEKLACFKCKEDCVNANQMQVLGRCEKCKGQLALKKTKKGGHLIGCDKCQQTIFLPDDMKKIVITDNQCQRCVQKNREIFEVKIQFKDFNFQHELHMKIYEEKDDVFCIFPKCDSSLNEFQIKFLQDQVYRNRQQNNNNQPNQINNQKKIKCFKCGQEDHLATQCKSNQVNKNEGVKPVKQIKKGKQKQQNQQNLNQNQNNAQNKNNQTSTITCYKCKKEGHFANNCDQNQQQPSNQQNRPQYNQQPQNNQQIQCFKCKQFGHYSNNCDQNQQQPSNQKNRPQQKNNQQIQQIQQIQCFKCKQNGHYSNNCPTN